MPKGKPRLGLNRGASRPFLAVLQRFHTTEGLQIILLLRALLAVSYLQNDGMFGPKQQLQQFMLWTDVALWYGFAQLSLRRSLILHQTYKGQDMPNFRTMDPNLCKTYFRFELQELYDIAEALGLLHQYDSIYPHHW